MKQRKWKHPILGLSLLLIIIAMIVTYQLWQQHKRMQPVINRHPTHYLTLYGHIDKGMSVQFSTFFETHNDDCLQYEDWAEGVMGTRYKEIFYQIIPDKNQNYVIKLPIDQIKSGYCQWSITRINYQGKFIDSDLLPLDDILVAINNNSNQLKENGIIKFYLYQVSDHIGETFDTDNVNPIITNKVTRLQADFYKTTKENL